MRSSLGALPEGSQHGQSCMQLQLAGGCARRCRGSCTGLSSSRRSARVRLWGARVFEQPLVRHACVARLCGTHAHNLSARSLLFLRQAVHPAALGDVKVVHLCGACACVLCVCCVCACEHGRYVCRRTQRAAAAAERAAGSGQAGAARGTAVNTRSRVRGGLAQWCCRTQGEACTSTR